METKEKRNQKARLLDDIGRICPELKPQIEKIQPPPPPPYTPGQLYPWLFSVTLAILKVVLHLGRLLLQEVLDRYVDGIDRPEEPLANGRQVCLCASCGSWIWHYNGKKRRPKQFRSIFGPQTLRRSQAECPRCGAVFYPIDEILGISRSVKLLPVLQQLVVFLGTHLPFREAAMVLEMTFGLRMAPGTIRDATRAVGQAFIRRQERGDWEPELARLRASMKGARGPFTLEVALDGAMVPLNEKPKASANSHMEARSASIRLKDGTGKLLAKYIFSRLTELAGFLSSIGALIDECRESLGIWRIILTGDGAKWIWEFGRAQAIPRTVLDWYHLLSRFLALAEAAGQGRSPVRRERLRRIRDHLWEGKVDHALEELRGFRARGAQERKAKRELVTYLKNNRDHIINYSWNWARRKLVGSGAIEGGQKKSISDRMKCSGMRWSKSGADEMMAARCTVLNNTADYDVRNANLAA